MTNNNNDILKPQVDVESRHDGTLLLTSPYAPGDLPRSTVHVLIERAAQFPDRTLIAEKISAADAPDEWLHLTYGDAVLGCRKVAQWLINQGANTQTPLAILSSSSINHFLMAWGAIFARVPYVPVSLSYSTVPGAYPKLQAVLDKVQPVFLFSESLDEQADALASIDFDLGGVTCISASEFNRRINTIAFHDLIDSVVTEKVQDSIDKINHDTVTRYMFTSGSTGMPKGVIHTHGMSCQMLAGSVVVRDTQPGLIESRVLDWMPWSHVGAGVMRIISMINAAGSIYLDTGKPLPDEFHKTIENLRYVKPTSYTGAPLGWAMLADALEADEELAQIFFTNVRTMASGSAAMPVSLANRLKLLTQKYKGQSIAFGTSLLSTEVMCGLSRYWPCDQADVIGLPAPGAEIKLVPFQDKYELRVRSKGTTPGYLHEPDKTAAAFDAEGFFKMGDAVRFADDNDACKGLVFAGRVAEEFKLQSGTWVSAGSLRAEVVAATSPYVRDIVVCGLNETDIALLIWPNVDRILHSQPLKQAISLGLAHHNQLNPGSSKRIARYLLLETAPDPGAFEITDKGYINQAEVLSRRSGEVKRLYSGKPDPDVIEVPNNQE